VNVKTARRYIGAAVAAGLIRDGGEGQLSEELLGAVRLARPDGHGDSCLVYRREAGKPNEIWQADHTQLDLWVIAPSGQPARSPSWSRPARGRKHSAGHDYRRLPAAGSGVLPGLAWRPGRPGG